MSELPKEIASHKTTVMGVELEVVVLDNGQRVIVGDGLEQLCAIFATIDGEDEPAIARAKGGE